MKTKGKHVLNQDTERKKKPKLDQDITDEQVEKYTRGEGVRSRQVRTRFFKDKFSRKEELAEFSVRQCKYLLQHRYLVHISFNSFF